MQFRSSSTNTTKKMVPKKVELEYEQACIGVEPAKRMEEELDLERKIVGEGRVA